MATPGHTRKIGTWHQKSCGYLGFLSSPWAPGFVGISTLSTIPGSSVVRYSWYLRLHLAMFSPRLQASACRRWYVQFRPIVPVDLQPPSTWAVSHGSAQLHPRVKPWCFTSGFVGRKSSDLVLPWIQASPSNIILLPWAVERFTVNWPVVSTGFHSSQHLGLVIFGSASPGTPDLFLGFTCQHPVLGVNNVNNFVPSTLDKQMMNANHFLIFCAILLSHHHHF